MTTSQNGWEAFPDYGDPHLTTNAGATVPGTSVMILGGLLAGDVATVLLHVAARFNKEVETLGQDHGLWGFEPRNIIGSNVISNHSSGTAMDLNAALHPLAARGTFSLSQVGAIHLILADMGGAVRWGGDYSGRVDEMHFEINTDAAGVAAIARRIGQVPTTEEFTVAQFDQIMAAIQALSDKVDKVAANAADTQLRVRGTDSNNPQPPFVNHDILQHIASLVDPNWGKE
jgi:hypothetical protein